MGDIFSHDANDRCEALGITPQRLSTAFGGRVAVLDDEYQSIMATPQSVEVRCRALSDRIGSLQTDLLRDWTGLVEGNDPDSGECCVFHHLRDMRRSLMRIRMQILVRGSASRLPPADCEIVADYDNLVRCTRRNAGADALLDDVDALRRRVLNRSRGGNTLGEIHPILSDLLDLMKENLAAFRARRSICTPARRERSPSQREHIDVVRSSSAGDSTPVFCQRMAPYPTTTTTHSARVVVAGAAKDKNTVPLANDGDACCSVCLDLAPGPRLPCGHKAACEPCTRALERCPLCRAWFAPTEVHWADDQSAPFIVPVPV